MLNRPLSSLRTSDQVEMVLMRQRYNDYAWNGSRIDQPALKAALADAYAFVGKPAPRLLVFDSPAACMIAAKALERVLYRGDVEKLRRSLKDAFGDGLFNRVNQTMHRSLWRPLYLKIMDEDWKDGWGHWRQAFPPQLNEQFGYMNFDGVWSRMQERLEAQTGQRFPDHVWEEMRPNLGTTNFDTHFVKGSQCLWQICFSRFAESIGVLMPDDVPSRLDIVEPISRQCEWWWPFETVVIASEKPEKVHLNASELPHCENGPSHAYADGFGFYTWNGMAIPPKWLKGRPPKPSGAVSYSNPNLRPAACEIVGWAKVMDHFAQRVIDDSGDPLWGRLVHVEPGRGRGMRFLEARCGTGRRVVLPVPENTRTVDEAQSVLHGGIPASILRNYERRT